MNGKQVLLIFASVSLSLSPFSCACCSPTNLCQDKGQPELAERLGKDVGSVIGLELRDRSLPLSPSNDRPVAPGMTFNVSIGEQGRLMYLMRKRALLIVCLMPVITANTSPSCAGHHRSSVPGAEEQASRRH